MKKFIHKAFHTEVDHNKRIFGLDLLRAIAIILVMIAHSKVFLGAFATRFNAWDIMDTITITGFLGVELFFVLSGFLIGSILIRQFDTEIIHSVRTVIKFLLRRWFRTLPNYYFVLILNIFIWIVLAGEDLGFNWKYFLFLQNFASPHPKFFGVAWSLSIEEWFYLILAVSLFITPIFFPKNKRKVMLTTIVGLFFVITISRVGYVFFYHAQWKDVAQKVVFRIDSILFGVIAAYIYYYHTRYWEKFKVSSMIAGMILILIACVMFLTKVVYFFDLPIPTYLCNTALFTIMSLGIALLLPQLNSIRTVARSFFSRSVTHISLISYSMYLLHHSIIQKPILAYIKRPWPMAFSVLIFILFWITVIVLSTLLYNLYERPVMKLRDRYTK